MIAPLAAGNARTGIANRLATVIHFGVDDDAATNDRILCAGDSTAERSRRTVAAQSQPDVFAHGETDR